MLYRTPSIQPKHRRYEGIERHVRRTRRKGTGTVQD